MSRAPGNDSHSNRSGKDNTPPGQHVSKCINTHVPAAPGTQQRCRSTRFNMKTASSARPTCTICYVLCSKQPDRPAYTDCGLERMFSMGLTTMGVSFVSACGARFAGVRQTYQRQTYTACQFTSSATPCAQQPVRPDFGISVLFQPPSSWAWPQAMRRRRHRSS